MSTLDGPMRPFALIPELSLRARLLTSTAPWIDPRLPMMVAPSPSSAVHLALNWRARRRPAKPPRYSSGAADWIEIDADDLQERPW